MIAKWAVGTEKIHHLDHVGHLFFHVQDQANLHALRYYQFWENCGVVGERFECSCGFSSTEHSGGGCWQYNHKEPVRHGIIDTVHANLILDATWHAIEEEVGFAREWRALAMLAIKDLKSASGSMATIKRAQKLASTLGVYMKE